MWTSKQVTNVYMGKRALNTIVANSLVHIFEKEKMKIVVKAANVNWPSSTSNILSTLGKNCKHFCHHCHHLHNKLNCCSKLRVLSCLIPNPIFQLLLHVCLYIVLYCRVCLKPRAFQKNKLEWVALDFPHNMLSRPTTSATHAFVRG